MNSPTLLSVAGLALFLAGVSAGNGAAPPRFVDTQPIVLRETVQNNIHTNFGITTTLTFNSAVPLTRIFVGADIVKVAKDPDMNRIQVTPTVEAGVTNMTLQFGERVYPLMIYVGGREEPLLTRTYNVEAMDGTTAPKIPGDDLDRLSAAPAMKPHEIPTVDVVDIIERAQVDATLRATQEDLRQFPINRLYRWNGVLVRLVDCSQFLDRDLLVLRVAWENTTRQPSARVLYMHGRQLGLNVAGQTIPVTAMMQKQARLFPGQRDTIYLFVQGYKIYGQQDWILTLPPEAAEVNRMLGR
jgi:hypothetical protein